jgi:hypothetical protein
MTRVGREMLSNECPNCGEAVVVFSRSCAHCGAYNLSRRVAIAVTASLATLVVAIGVAIFAVVGWHRAPGSTSEQATEDFTWLQAAMKECDEVAAKAPDSLYFLVVPLASAPEDDDSWRKASLNDLGNALLLKADVALDNLMQGYLVLSSEQYRFNIRDEATSTVFKWSPSTGVKRFSTNEAKSIENFKVQLLTDSRTNESAWGAAFIRQKGTCYWVNAIVGH